MSTTTIRLSDDMKKKIAEAAQRSGTTPHSFILDAIAQKVEAEALRAGFEDEAAQRFERILTTGQTVGWDAMRSYLEQRAAGHRAEPPLPRQLPD